MDSNRSQAWKLAWRVIRYRHYHEHGERHPPEHQIARLASIIEELIDGQALDALPRGAESSHWDTWHEPPNLPRL